MNDEPSLVEQTGYYGGGINFDDYTNSRSESYERHLSSYKKYAHEDYYHLFEKEKWISLKHFIYMNRFTCIDIDESEFRFNPEGRLTKHNMAYLWFPHIHHDGDEEYVSRSMVYKSMKIIYALWLKKPDGWIIDLRANTGGIVEYFIASISQFIDEFEIKGYDRRGRENSSIASKGNTFRMTIEDDIVFDIEFPFKLEIETSNISVLIDNNTASAAEIIALLLRRYKDAKIYGQDSYGVISLMSTTSYYDFNLVFPVSKIKFDDNSVEKVVPDIYGIPEHLYPE